MSSGNVAEFEREFVHLCLDGLFGPKDLHATSGFDFMFKVLISLSLGSN